MNTASKTPRPRQSGRGGLALRAKKCADGFCRLCAFFMGGATASGPQARIVYIGAKSYCDVYEKAVVGTTCLSASNPNTPVQNFEPSYEQIQNVTELARACLKHVNMPNRRGFCPLDGAIFP